MTEDPRISEIRAVLDEEIPSDQTFDVGNFVKLQRIRAILDRPAPNKYRLWNQGDAEPSTDVDRLRDRVGDILGRDEFGWLYVEVRGRVIPDMEREDGVPWSDLDDVFDVAWPLEREAA